MIVDVAVAVYRSFADKSQSVLDDVPSMQENNEDDGEIIRCVCNMYCDEGLMIQCDRCQVCSARLGESVVYVWKIVF